MKRIGEILARLFLTIIALQALTKPAYAQLSEFKITASDGAASDRFGISVSTSGDYAVVGAYFDDDNGDESGSVYVFKRAGTSWVQEAKLRPSDGAAGDQFGWSASISGDYAVVGAESDDDNGTDAGSAYLFKRTGRSWTEEAKIIPFDGAGDDNFGNSVSISGDYAVVGAYGDDDNENDAGSAYLFKRTVTSLAEEIKLLPSDGAFNDLFGYSVSISGYYAVVGAESDDDNGFASGSAYLFKRTGTSWAEEDKLLPSDGAAEDRFGISVSISGDYAVVGAYLHSDNGSSSGSAYLFKRTGTSWAEEDKLLPSDGAAGDLFGWSVSISGDCVVVGAHQNDDNFNDSGSAYLFCGFTLSIGIEREIAGLPTDFALSQNYPNPFNPVTVIDYALLVRSDVRLTIYNLRGEEVALLIDGTVSAGNYRATWDASNVSSGIYLYRLQAGDFVRTRKMLLLK